MVKKTREFQKNIYSASLASLKPLTVDHNKLWKFLKRWEYQTTWPASWEICMQVRKQQLELDMKQQTGSKLGKEYIKAVYCHPAYLTYMQSSVQFSHSVMSDSLWPHGLQHSSLPCPSPTPGACSNLYPSNQRCHPTISYVEYTMRSARLDEAHAGIKIARRNINNLRYADDKTSWQKVKRN